MTPEQLMKAGNDGGYAHIPLQPHYADYATEEVISHLLDSLNELTPTCDLCAVYYEDGSGDVVCEAHGETLFAFGDEFMLYRRLMYAISVAVRIKNGLE